MPVDNHESAATRPSEPRLSAVVFVRDRLAFLERALSALSNLEFADQIEVIVVDGSSDGDGRQVVERFPCVRYLSIAEATMPEAKAVGIRVAGGHLIAILDGVAEVDRGWLREVLAAMEDESLAAVGGAVMLDWIEGAANRALYLFEYGKFNPPIKDGPTNGDLPGNNVVYRRSWLLKDGDTLLDEVGFNKPFFHERIRRSGGILALRQNMQVNHLVRYQFVEAATSRFHFGRCFGAIRRQRSTWLRKLLLLIGSPTVPMILFVRHFRRALNHPGNRRLLVGAKAALAGICLAWGLGEWLGAWFGPGGSCEKLY